MEENPISFVEWLTKRRKSLSLTRVALARRIPCSVSTLRRLEADDLRASVALAGLLAPVLRIPADQQAAFVAFARGERAELPVEQPVPASHLPAPLTRMVDRKRETAAIVAALRKPGVRLLTLTGPPGTGKTRLSLAAAQKLAHSFRDGAHFVALAPVADHEAVVAAIAQALGVKEADAGIFETLVGYLRNRRLLLVLDNFEHLVSAAPFVSALLHEAPFIKALVTSRETLHLYGEHEFPVPPLEFIDVRHLPATESLALYSRYSSIQFFKERACAANPDFHLTRENAADVARICAWLDGLPLAIEIAAAHIKWHAPDQLYAQLRDRLETLSDGPRDLSPRQQSLRGAIDWSFNLLGETEKRVFSVMGIFADGCTEDTIYAARSLIFDKAEEGTDQIEMLGMIIRSLVEKNLVRHELAPDGAPRYSMLETLRGYARAQLAARDLLERAEAWHCEYYLNFAQSARPHIQQGDNQVYWLAKMEREYNNLGAALAWATALPGRAATAIQLVQNVIVFWNARGGYYSEKRRWLDQILVCDPTPTPIRAALLRQASEAASSQGDFAHAQAFEEEGMAISKSLGDEAGVHDSLEGLAKLAGMRGDYATAAELLEQVLVYRKLAPDPLRLTATLNNLAIANRRLGNLERARQLYAEAIQVTKSVGNFRSLARALLGMAEVHTDLREYAEASGLLRESISIRHQLGEMKGLANALDTLGMTIYPLGNKILAAQLESASSKMRRELGVVIPPATRAESEDFIARLRAELGESAFEKAWLGGQTMSLEQVVALALKDT
jgi:predicted ATPase/transcriptional regulator with XRE-family HTH domain